ncbi:MAG: DUF2203 domain-containing protein [Acidobacteriota bacterium]
MKLFTIEEANELLAGVRSMLEKIQSMYSALGRFREAARNAAAASELGGGMQGGAEYVKALYEVGKLTTELNESGIQLKDYSRGLIDFPCMREGRVVLLCWQLGEAEQIEWWHEIEAGFADRKPL